MADYYQGTVTVTATATLVCTVMPESGGVLIQNSGTSPVILGGASVTATGATQGVSVAASSTLMVPSVAGFSHTLWAVTASGTATVSFLCPAA